MAYDRADFDYSTEAEPLPPGHAGTHIGMFLAWAASRGFINDWHREHFPDLLARLERRQITGRQFFEAAGRGNFSERDLSPEGNNFAEYYYRDQAGNRGPYFDDYRKILAGKLPSFWHVPDTWDNFDRIAPVIDRRYQEWVKPPRKWWQFWRR